MPEALDRYKTFFAKLLLFRGSHWAFRMRYNRHWPSPEELASMRARSSRPDAAQSAVYPEDWARWNALLDSLTEQQRAEIADLFQRTHTAAMIFTLHVLAEGQYHLRQDDVDLPFEPFGRTYFGEFARLLNDRTWPDEEPAS